MPGLQSYYVALLALVVGGYLTEARTIQNRRVQSAKQTAAIRNAASPKKTQKSHLKVKASKHAPLVGDARINELVVGLLGNTVKRGTEMLKEEMMTCQDEKSFSLSKELTALKHALDSKTESKTADSDRHAPGWSALMAGIKEWQLDAASSKKKVSDVLAACLPDDKPSKK